VSGSRGFAIRAAWGLDVLEQADTIVVPGCAEDAPPPGQAVLDALRRAAARDPQAGNGAS